MLRYSNYTPAEIGNYLSFSTQSYFTRIFRKYTGTTPAAWRKIIRPIAKRFLPAGMRNRSS